MHTPQTPKPAHEIDTAGGAYVRRRFNYAGTEKIAGDTLTREQVRAIPRANLNALLNGGMIELWPTAPADGGGVVASERFAAHLGAGKYIVIEGRKITPEPVTREAADALIAA